MNMLFTYVQCLYSAFFASKVKPLLYSFFSNGLFEEFKDIFLNEDKGNFFNEDLIKKEIYTHYEFEKKIQFNSLF